MHNNEYFALITDSMLVTNPGLRDLLRDRFHVDDGYYNGVGALEYVTTWIHSLHTRHPEHSFYENVLAELVKHRLPIGASAQSFSAVVRRFTHDINPFLRAPYAGEPLGEFILEHLMPPYQDAIER